MMPVKNKFIKDNMTILFYGDSITDDGRDREDKFSLGNQWSRSHCIQVSQCIKEKYPDYNFTFYNRGISGDKTADLVRRAKEDCIDLNPDLIILLVGVNDIWDYGKDDDFTRDNYRTLLNKIKSELSDTKLIVCTPFLLPNVCDRDYHRPNMERKIEIITSLAKPLADIFIESDPLLHSCITKYITARALSFDGIHLTEAGYTIIAQEILYRMNLIED